MKVKGRVFSGMRPSGRLHIGNYLGALRNWVELQKQYECIFCVVDVHALTTLGSNDSSLIQDDVREMVLDWLAAGIDPDRSIVFVQSKVPEVMSLYTILGMITPMGWLLRVPTFKEKVRQMDETEDSVNYGLVGYPVLMAADIILYKADTVPVGEDQVPHLELTREIVRRFNNKFGDFFPEPQAKLTETPLIVGLDGKQKMSKTLDNHIDLAASPEETTKRVVSAFTDPKRLRRSDPGRPSKCNVYALHKLYNPDQCGVISSECKEATRGCVDCKEQLAQGINSELKTFRERRLEFESKPDYVSHVLEDGARKASKIAKLNLAEAMERVGLNR